MIDIEERLRREASAKTKRLRTRLANEVRKKEKLREEVLRWRVVAQFTLQAWEDGNSDNLEKAMNRIEAGLK